MSLEPPKVQIKSKFNRDDFKKIIPVPTLNFDPSKTSVSNLVKKIKPFLMKIQKFHAIRDGKIYLNPDVVTKFSQLPVNELISEGIDESSFSHQDVELNYENWKADELVKAIVPDGIEPATSFSQIGHIIHLNLKDELLPYKQAIAKIYLDKIPNCKTVVNKVHNIDNTFRNFQMELLEGEAVYNVQVKENGVIFEFDFESVYWNPRLSTEHERIVKLLQPNDFFYDVFAGVGPFSVPAGKKRVNVLANDLNPHSFKWLQHNVVKNKVGSYVSTYNLDGREFIMNEVRNSFIERIQRRQSDPSNYSIRIAMNLPALAVNFLDAFVGLLKNNENGLKDSNMIPTPICHCYCFVKGNDDPKEMAQKLVENHVGFKLTREKTLKEISFVRNVAPNKNMMRVDLLLTSDILFGKVLNKRTNGSNNVDGEIPCKKTCTRDGEKQEETTAAVKSKAVD